MPPSGEAAADAGIGGCTLIPIPPRKAPEGVPRSAAESDCVPDATFFVRTGRLSAGSCSQKRIDDETAAVNPREGAQGSLAPRSYGAGDSSFRQGACSGNGIIQGCDER